MRFAMTARTVARQRAQGFDTLNETTTLNVKKVTQFRENGVENLEEAIKRLELQDGAGKSTAGKDGVESKER